MSKPSQKVIHGLLKLHFNQHLVNHSAATSSFQAPLSRTLSSSSSTSIRVLNSSQVQPNFPSKPIFSNGGLSQILSPTMRTSGISPLGTNPFACEFRLLSFRAAQDLGDKLKESFAKKLFEKPATALSNAFSRYREAIGLQIEAFCKRNYVFLLGAGGILVCALLWKIMFGVASTFIQLSEDMAKFGFLALSSSIVIAAGLYLRSRFTINPDKVYRMAMRKLNTSAGILEVMGAPLAGSEIRAYVMSGGGLTLKNFKPNIRSKRCFLIFPIRGSERKGLVSVEVKKKKGQYDTKLLAVDIPMASGPEQRLFLIGDEEEYKVGGGLISELRDPLVKAMASTKEFDALDEIEEEQDAQREIQEAERKQREELEKLEKARS